MEYPVSYWKCHNCGAANYMRTDKAPCVCGTPQPATYFVARGNEPLPLNLVWANYHLYAWLKGDSDLAWIKVCTRTNGNAEGLKAKRILNRYHNQFPNLWF